MFDWCLISPHLKTISTLRHIFVKEASRIATDTYYAFMKDNHLAEDDSGNICYVGDALFLKEYDADMFYAHISVETGDVHLTPYLSKSKISSILATGDVLQMIDYLHRVANLVEKSQGVSPDFSVDARMAAHKLDFDTAEPVRDSSIQKIVYSHDTILRYGRKNAQLPKNKYFVDALQAAYDGNVQDFYRTRKLRTHPELIGVVETWKESKEAICKKAEELQARCDAISDLMVERNQAKAELDAYLKKHDLEVVWNEWESENDRLKIAKYNSDCFDAEVLFVFEDDRTHKQTIADRDFEEFYYSDCFAANDLSGNFWESVRLTPVIRKYMVEKVMSSSKALDVIRYFREMFPTVEVRN